MSSQSECANPGVRLTVLYREAETGKRLISSAQAIGIFASACGEHRSSSISSIGSAAALLRPPFCLR